MEQIVGQEYAYFVHFDLYISRLEQFCACIRTSSPPNDTTDIQSSLLKRAKLELEVYIFVFAIVHLGQALWPIVSWYKHSCALHYVDFNPP